MPLQENLRVEVGKGVLTERGHFYSSAHTEGEVTPMRAEGVVKAVEQEAGEELHGGTELATGSAGWRNNRRGLPLVRCSQRKMTAGKSCGLALLAGTAGKLLVQEGCADEALLLAWLDSSG
jgi:hypothetical protein